MSSELRVARYAFQPTSSDELEFRKGDRISVLEQGEDGWWLGRHTDAPDSTPGLFPANYMYEAAQPTK